MKKLSSDAIKFSLFMGGLSAFLIWGFSFYPLKHYFCWDETLREFVEPEGILIWLKIWGTSLTPALIGGLILGRLSIYLLDKRQRYYIGGEK
jgi:hypothetical protein